MAGLMNNYFYGKAGKGDYTVDQMPTTRKQLFFTTLRVRFSSMVGLNLLHVVFLLPMIIWLFINYQTLTMYATDEAYKLGGAEMKAAYEAYIEKYDLYNAIQNEAQNTAELEYELGDVNAKIAKIEAGETIMVKEAPVVEGGEETERPATVEELTNLRVNLRKAGGEFYVVKNTLARIAFTGGTHDVVKDKFHDNSAIALGFDDPVAVAKALSDFAKQSKLFQLRCGSLEGKEMSAEQVEALAKLPSKEQLLGQLLGTMNAVPTNFVSLFANVLRGLLYALKAIEEKKGEAA